MKRLSFDIDEKEIADFCQRWGLRELSVFGSAVRGELKPSSDVDVLIELPANRFPEIEEWDAMQRELTAILGRPVDLISARGIENPFVRHRIFTTREILYAA